MSKVKIVNADILEWCKQYRGEKFHALFCDAPYELAFMNKSWDSSGIAFNPDTWATLAEHFLPGAFMFVFAGTLNDDLISVAMRQAGLRKFHKACLWWSYGSGFPKSSRIDVAIDRAAGKKRYKIVDEKWAVRYPNGPKGKTTQLTNGGRSNRIGVPMKELPATPLAKTWVGHRYGLQALKPAAETILIFQKSYNGKPVDSIVKNGAGALWVDGGRIEAHGEKTGSNGAAGLKLERGWNANNMSRTVCREQSITQGRWPANLILQHSPDCNGTCSPECVVRELDEQSGMSKSTGGDGSGFGKNPAIFQASGRAIVHNNNGNGLGLGDTGGASRFFFNADWNHEAAEQISNAAAVRCVAKAAGRERNKNVEEFYWHKNKKSSVGFDRITFSEWKKLKPEDRAQGNIHSTVKPLSLCKYLATLLLPPAEYAPRRILIPFAGVASEAIGAMLAGWEEVTAIEKEKEYCDIGRARVKYWQNHKEPIVKKSKPPKVMASQVAELFPELA